MGALAADQGPIGNIPPVPVPAEAFEAPDIDERVIAERERELGLTTSPPPTVWRDTPMATPYVPRESPLPGPVIHQTRPTPMMEPIADLASLPDTFSLSIERKGEMWKVTAPGVHTGLWKAGNDLSQVVHEALAALSEMVRIDGIVAKARRK